MIVSIQVLRVNLATAALCTVVLTAGHAVARNHDWQAARPASTVQALHDRAPGPAVRPPN